MTATDDARFAADHQDWRDPAGVVAQWREAGECDPALLEAEATGPWWDILAEAAVTLLVTREYEHLVLALSAPGGTPRTSYLRLPHPSGIAVDAARGEVHLASTRNPNVLYTLRPADGLLARGDLEAPHAPGRPLLPAAARFLPGSTYLHDLAMLDGRLLGNAVGSNCVLAFDGAADPVPAWWPACIEGASGPDFSLNHLQLNGIAAGADLAGSRFTASTDRIGGPRPGQLDFAPEGLGVVFSGASREPVVRGLTRPHSPRFVGGLLWLDNSGFGTVVACGQDGGFETVARLPGWTRGLCVLGRHAIVGTSRIIPRFRHYAPGLVPDECLCGLHAVDIASGLIVASLAWPAGNQVFAVEALPAWLADRLPFLPLRRGGPGPAERTLFYAWRAAPAPPPATERDR